MPALAAATFDREVAVIGDIHGRSDLLRRLLARLPVGIPILVLGDVGDRGPDTRGTIDTLLAHGGTGVRGNHDEWLTAWACGRGFDRFALSPKMGGRATLDSYGVQASDPDAIDAEADRVPDAHRAWIAALPVALDLRVCGEPYWLVHAGVPSTEPLVGVPIAEVVPHLARTNPAVLLWSATDPDEMLPVDRTVIMGHRRRKRPLDAGHVLAIDTGAGMPEGALTAVVLPERRFVTVG
jgi:serine/threonine protein phosphatase 1